jgi:hypothetical protein
LGGFTRADRHRERQSSIGNDLASTQQRLAWIIGKLHDNVA